MLDKTRQAILLTAGRTHEEFTRDDALKLAITHLLQIIGEAARRVSPDLRQAHPEIPWSAAIGMRHRVVHDYFSVDYDIVWATATQDLPPLVRSLEALADVLGGH